MDEIDVLINDVWYMIFWCVNACNWFFNILTIFIQQLIILKKIKNIFKYKYFKLLMIQRQFCTFGKILKLKTKFNVKINKRTLDQLYFKNYMEQNSTWWSSISISFLCSNSNILNGNISFDCSRLTIKDTLDKREKKMEYHYIYMKTNQ
jgi:hypothetical protein